MKLRAGKATVQEAAGLQPVALPLLGHDIAPGWTAWQLKCPPRVAT